MTEDDAREHKKRAILIQVGKGIGALAILVFLMLWLAGAFVTKVGPRAAAAPEAGPRAVRKGLTVVKAALKTFPLLIEQVGTIRTRNEAQVSSRLMAQVKEIRVNAGDWVSGPEAGANRTVLATLDDRALREKLKEAKAQADALDHAVSEAQAKLRAAQAQVSAAIANRKKAAEDFLRYQNLSKNGAATAQRAEHARTEMDVANAQAASAIQDVQAARGNIARLKAQKKQAEAAVNQARIMLSYTVISAPFSGRVVKKMLNPGNMAIPGQPIFFLDVPSLAEVHAIVSESLVPFLKIGQKIEVRIDALHRTMTGQIREIVPQAEVATRTTLVKIALPAFSDLVNGLFARIYVPYGSYKALVIPARAVREVGELYLVDTLGPQGHRVRRFIRPGRTRGPLVEVLSGLKEGEEVVVP